MTYHLDTVNHDASGTVITGVTIYACPGLRCTACQIGSGFRVTVRTTTAGDRAEV